VSVPNTVVPRTRLAATVVIVLGAAVAVLAAPKGPQTRPAAAPVAPAATTAPARPSAATAPAAAVTARKDIVPIPLELPVPTFVGTPTNLPPDTRIRPAKGPSLPRKPFLAPKGVRNVALKKPVTASDTEPIIGTTDLVTDGDTAAATESYVEFGPNVQWVQIDLQASHRVYAVVVWHEHTQPIVYHDVVVQLADDKDFITNVRTIYSNDHDNSAGLGIGLDWEYFETHEGLLVDAGGLTARYVRLYSNGTTETERNRYTEVQVFGLPVKGPRK